MCADRGEPALNGPCACERPNYSVLRTKSVAAEDAFATPPLRLPRRELRCTRLGSLGPAAMMHARTPNTYAMRTALHRGTISTG